VRLRVGFLFDLHRRRTMKIQVHYDVPVSAVVDTESGKVDEVLVWCEGIEERNDLNAVVDADTQLPVDLEDRVRAHEIVDSAVWPEWRFE
jgi:hypothetical protein